MKTYRNEHVTVEVECDVHLLRQTWLGLPSNENFRDGSRATLAFAKQHRIKRWLIDLRSLRLFNPTDLHWFIQQWLPEADRYLPHDVRIAIVLNDPHQFGKLGADRILRASGHLNGQLASRYVLNEAEARLWLFQP